MRSIWRYRSICLLGSSDPTAETLLRGAVTVFTQNNPDGVRSHCDDEQLFFTRADTRSGPPSGSQRAPSRAFGETMPLGRCRRVIAVGFGCLFFHLSPKPRVLPRFRGQNWRGPGGFPPSPLTKISQPVSRVLYG